jgi:osmotically-inducible protein OsmY
MDWGFLQKSNDYQRCLGAYYLENYSKFAGLSNEVLAQTADKIRDAIEKKDVENALKRSAIDDRDIEVAVSGTTVSLTGSVNSWYQKEEAGRIAWNTPGIWRVDNDLAVEHKYFLG